MTRLRSVAFDPTVHDVLSFDSGEPILDQWLKEQAASAQLRRTSRTWVWMDSSNSVVAYYALAAHVIAREQVPQRVGRGGPRQIPAVLLAKLALSVQLQGQGLGSILVADALQRVLIATQTVGARVVVVDALNEDVVGFYEALGFKRLPHSLKMIQIISDIQASAAEIKM